LQTWFKRFKRPTRKKLILVGRGLKATFLRTNTFKILKLKLEYSHFNLIFIPPSIKIKIRKNILTFESFNSSRLGSFLERIKILKLPNIYKGKGIRVKYFKQNLKQIKKSK
jgi:ribosomal protein L6P/L9E